MPSEYEQHTFLDIQSSKSELTWSLPAECKAICDLDMDQLHMLYLFYKNCKKITYIIWFWV